MEQNFFEREAHFESNGDVSFKQKWKPISGAASTVSESENGCFECNICLDSADEPVVTLCGHLYCWPCIYKWLQVQTNSDEPDQPSCPVCKTNISHEALVPLYGRGASRSDSESKKPQLGLVIPRRPLPSGTNVIFTSSSPQNHQQNQLHPSYFQPSSRQFHQQYFPHPYGAHAQSHVSGNLAQPHLGGTVMTSSLISPTIGVFGEMVFTRMFGSPGPGTNLFAYPPMVASGNGSPRMRRQEVQVDKSLNRVSIFLFCCIILCLLLF